MQWRHVNYVHRRARRCTGGSFCRLPQDPAVAVALTSNTRRCSKKKRFCLQGIAATSSSPRRQPDWHRRKSERARRRKELASNNDRGAMSAHKTKTIDHCIDEIDSYASLVQPQHRLPCIQEHTSSLDAATLLLTGVQWHRRRHQLIARRSWGPFERTAAVPSRLPKPSRKRPVPVWKAMT